MMTWKHIHSVLFTYGCMLVIALCIFMTHSSYAQDAQQDSLYWVQDSILDQRIDTIGVNTVRKEIYSGIRRAIKFSKKPNAYLPADSIDTWMRWMRWAVILNDKQGLKMIDDLLLRVEKGRHGDWHYYYEFMIRWAAYEGRVKGYSVAQKSDMVLSHFNNGTPIENDFYEQRLLDLGAAGIPSILAWARAHLIPRMDELDKEMLSEQDLAFTRTYDRFLMVFSSMIVDEASAGLIRALKQERDEHVQRFANDVLHSAGY